MPVSRPTQSPTASKAVSNTAWRPSRLARPAPPPSTPHRWPAEQHDASHPAAVAQQQQQQQQNLRLLRQLVPASSKLPEQLLQQHPGLLAGTDLGLWADFLLGYGVSREGLARLLLSCPELFERSNIYACGRTMLLFKELGWSDADILARIVPQYPGLLAKQVEADMLPVLVYLRRDMGCSQADVRLLVWEFPRVFSSNFRRHIRKFQHLGLYGLPPSAEVRGSSRPPVPDSLSRLMMAVH